MYFRQIARGERLTWSLELDEIESFVLGCAYRVRIRHLIGNGDDVDRRSLMLARLRKNSANLPVSNRDNAVKWLTEASTVVNDYQVGLLAMEEVLQVNNSAGGGRIAELLPVNLGNQIHAAGELAARMSEEAAVIELNPQELKPENFF